MKDDETTQPERAGVEARSRRKRGKVYAWVMGEGFSDYREEKSRGTLRERGAEERCEKSSKKEGKRQKIEEVA